MNAEQRIAELEAELEEAKLLNKVLEKEKMALKLQRKAANIRAQIAIDRLKVERKKQSKE